jgi:WhiB family transcriptional regulator, redox-sensing transcriptional regulator
MDQAACRQRTDLDWFDLDCNLEECLKVCMTCQVADDCLMYAIETDAREGIWGGEWGYRLARYLDGGDR